MSLTAGFHPSYYSDDSSHYDDYSGYDDDYDYYGDGSYDDSYDHDGFFDEDGNYYQHDGYGNYYDEDNDEYYDDSYDHGYGYGHSHHDQNINNYYDSHNYTNAPNHSRSMSNHYYGGNGRGMNHPNGYGGGYGGGQGGGYYGSGYGGRYQPSPTCHDHQDSEQFEFHDAQEEQHDGPHEVEYQPDFAPITRSATSSPYSRTSPATPTGGTGVLGRAHSVMWRSPTPRLNANNERSLPRLMMPDMPETGNQKHSPLTLFHNRFWRSSSSPSSSRPRTPHSPQSYYTPMEEPYQHNELSS